MFQRLSFVFFGLILGSVFFSAEAATKKYRFDVSCFEALIITCNSQTKHIESKKGKKKKKKRGSLLVLRLMTFF